MTEPTELLPCPFCGGDARTDAHADDCYFMLHRKLNALPESDLSMHLEVLAAWNRRTPQPTQAQAGAVPLSDGQAKEVLWTEHLRWMQAAGLDTEGMRPTGEWLDHWLTYVRAIERAHGIGIKGGQHGADN